MQRIIKRNIFDIRELSIKENKNNEISTFFEFIKKFKDDNTKIIILPTNNNSCFINKNSNLNINYYIFDKIGYKDNNEIYIMNYNCMYIDQNTIFCRCPQKECHALARYDFTEKKIYILRDHNMCYQSHLKYFLDKETTIIFDNINKNKYQVVITVLDNNIQKDEQKLDNSEEIQEIININENSDKNEIFYEIDHNILKNSIIYKNSKKLVKNYLGFYSFLSMHFHKGKQNKIYSYYLTHFLKVSELFYFKCKNIKCNVRATYDLKSHTFMITKGYHTDKCLSKKFIKEKTSYILDILKLFEDNPNITDVQCYYKINDFAMLE